MEKLDWLNCKKVINMIFLTISLIICLFLYCCCVVANRVDREDEFRRNIERNKK